VVTGSNFRAERSDNPEDPSPRNFVPVTIFASGIRAWLFCILLAFFVASPIPAQPHRTTKYTLPPDKLQKAVDYAHARNCLYFTSQIYPPAVLLAILALGFAAKFRDWAEATSSRRVIQALIFVPLLLLTIHLLNLPLALYSQHLERMFQQSIQSWPSWFWDWAKAELLTILLTSFVAFILYGVIRRSPTRCGFTFGWPRFP
jgi:STE24 endopeptidase